MLKLLKKQNVRERHIEMLQITKSKCARKKTN